jgi:hypothetical protein
MPVPKFVKPRLSNRWMVAAGHGAKFAPASDKWEITGFNYTYTTGSKGTEVVDDDWNDMR